MTNWENVRIPNGLIASKAEFVDRFGSIYEHSAWVAEAAWSEVGNCTIRTFGSLAEIMAKAVANSSDSSKLLLLRAHPQLASKAALAGELTAASNQEQSAAGLNACSPDELLQIQKLNADYSGKFGFPFIIAVTGLTRGEIIAAMARRVGNSDETEFAEALRQVDCIAQIRLAAEARKTDETEG